MRTVKESWNPTKTMRLIIFPQPSVFIRGHLHAQLEHGWWHRTITIPPHLDTQIKDLRPNATGIGPDSDRSLNCRSYQNLTNQRRRKSVTMAPKNKSGLPKLFYFALNARRLLISAHITQQEPRGSSVEFHISWPFVKLRLVLVK